MKKEDLFNEAFLKQFKNSEEFGDFVNQLYKRGVEQMLEGELEAHLGYQKHQPNDSSNARNGHSSKSIKTEHGKVQIKVPRDRDSSFEPQIVPKRSQLSKGIESLIISLYAKGMSNADIEQQLYEVYDFSVSPSTISKVTDQVGSDALPWQTRPIEPVYLVVWTRQSHKN